MASHMKTADKNALVEGCKKEVIDFKARHKGSGQKKQKRDSHKKYVPLVNHQIWFAYKAKSQSPVNSGSKSIKALKLPNGDSVPGYILLQTLLADL